MNELIAAIGAPADWMSRGACVGLDPDLFHPEQRGSGTAAAKAVCAGCPVKAECLDHAIRNGETRGVWGGTAERERRTLRAAWAAENGIDLHGHRRELIKHGTKEGHASCVRHNGTACRACKDAWSRWMEFRPTRARRETA